MSRQPAEAVPGWSTFRVVCIAFATALLVTLLGIVLTAVWLWRARDPSCGDSDCDQGVALIAMFFFVVSFAVGVVAGAITGGVLAARHLSAGQRGRAAWRAAVAALLPLSLLVVYVSVAF